MRRALAVLATALPGSAFADVPSVVTDTPVVHSLTSRIMGELGKPSVILEPGADPHSFQLRPSQAAALGDADLVFWAGEELTPWLARAVGNLGGGATLVTLLDVDGLSLIESGDGTHDHGHEQDDDHDHGHDEHAADDHDHHHDHDHAEDDHGHGDDHAHDDDHAHGDHDHGGIDPHAWLDPAHGMLWADEIAAALAAADPDNAATYAANAEAAKSDISAAADRAAGRLADLDGRSIITFHDAYGYFARAFDIRVAGSVALGDAAAPGARRVSELRETAGGAGIACIFSEPQHDASIAEAISRDTGIPLGTLDPSGSTMDYGPGLYPALLETMAAAIADCALISR